MKAWISISEDAGIEVDSDPRSLYTSSALITFTNGDVAVTHRMSQHDIGTLMNLLNLAAHEIQWREKRRKELSI